MSDRYIQSLLAEIIALRQKVVDLQNYILKLDRRQNAEIGDKEDAEIQG
jgi:hypothetical protein